MVNIFKTLRLYGEIHDLSGTFGEETVFLIIFFHCLWACGCWLECWATYDVGNPKTYCYLGPHTLQFTPSASILTFLPSVTRTTTTLSADYHQYMSPLQFYLSLNPTSKQPITPSTFFLRFALLHCICRSRNGYSHHWFVAFQFRSKL